METLLRGLPTEREITPFFREGNSIRFFVRVGAKVDYGHAFDPDRGYRVAIWFHGVPFRNTVGAADVKRLVDDLKLDTLGRDAKRCADALREMARQAEIINADWENKGRPRQGVPDHPLLHS